MNCSDIKEVDGTVFNTQVTNAFSDLDVYIEKILSKTFNKEIKVKNSYYVEETDDESACWYFQFEYLSNERLIQIMPFINGVELYTIEDIETFKKEFPLKENKAIYLIFNHDVINCSWHLPVYDAYRFVNAMLEYGFKMEI